MQFLTYFFAGGGGGAVWLGGSFGHHLILLWWNLFPLVIFSLFVVVFVGGGEGGVYVPKFYLCNKHLVTFHVCLFLWWSLFLLVVVVREGMFNVPKFYLCNKHLFSFRGITSCVVVTTHWLSQFCFQTKLRRRTWKGERRRGRQRWVHQFSPLFQKWPVEAQLVNYNCCYNKERRRGGGGGRYFMGAMVVGYVLLCVCVCGCFSFRI